PRGQATPGSRPEVTTGWSVASRTLDVKKGTAAIAKADPAMGAFMRRAGPYEPRPGQGDYFGSLARAIVFQQLAGRAASAIHGRFVTAIGGQVTPEAVVAASPEALRGAG